MASTKSDIPTTQVAPIYKQRQAELGLTGNQISERAGISPSNYSAIIHRKRPCIRMKTHKVISAVLELDYRTCTPLTFTSISFDVCRYVQAMVDPLGPGLDVPKIMKVAKDLYHRDRESGWELLEIRDGVLRFKQ